MSLKEKAFYVWFEPKDIKKEPRKVCQGNSCPLYDSYYGTMQCGYFSGGWCNHLKYGEVYDKLLVKFEDAQKEIDKLTEQRNIESKIVDRMLKEKEELKQKLQQLLNEFPRKLWDEAFDWRDYATEEIDEWKQKFEELLKEVK
jgi:hypothetical protein